MIKHPVLLLITFMFLLIWKVGLVHKTIQQVPESVSRVSLKKKEVIIVSNILSGNYLIFALLDLLLYLTVYSVSLYLRVNDLYSRDMLI